MRLIEDMKQYFYVIHVHANNHNKVLAAVGIPNVLELSFLRRDLATPTQLRTHLPIEGIDFPNDRSKEDYEIVFVS